MNIKESNLNSNDKINNSDLNNVLNLHFLFDITNDSYNCLFNNTSVVFRSVNSLLYLVYTTINNSMICFDLEKFKKISEIKNPKDKKIRAIKHHTDKKNKNDLIMTIYPMDKNIRIWNVKNWECLLFINNAFAESILYSACFYNKNNQIYIVASNCNYFGESEQTKIFDLHGNKIKEINDRDDAILIIEIYYDKKNRKDYIITGNKNYMKSFNLEKNCLYHKYFDEVNGAHFNFTVYENEEVVKLIESCEDGNIRIWNFNSGNLINKIKLSNKEIYNVCLWNKNYIICGSKDNLLYIVDIQNSKIRKSLLGHNNHVVWIQKIKHIKFDECILSQGLENDNIKLWSIQNES